MARYEWVLSKPLESNLNIHDDKPQIEIEFQRNDPPVTDNNMPREDWEKGKIESKIIAINSLFFNFLTHLK